MMESFAKYFVLYVQNIISGREWGKRESRGLKGEERERESEKPVREEKNECTERNPKRVGPRPPSVFAHLVEDRIPSSSLDVCAIVLI